MLVCVSFWEIAHSLAQRLIIHILYLVLGFDDEAKIVKPEFEAENLLENLIPHLLAFLSQIK